MLNMRLLTTSIPFLSLLTSTATSQSTQPINRPLNVSDPVIDLSYAKFLGLTNTTTNITTFKGLQYAAPPTGSYRWRKPRPIDNPKNHNFSSDQIYNATVKAPACLQSYPEPFYTKQGWNEYYPPGGESEDCLILNVLVPNFGTEREEGLPVAVLIHGGGYDGGDAEWFPGEAMLDASGGKMVCVQIQYRLGMLGFLGGSAVRDDGVMNAGLLDQRAALEWVQRNIGSFGGDPARVTIWGGSAGGGSVTAHLIAGGGYDEPPFSKAIAEYPWWQPFLNTSQQETTYRYALELSKCSTLTCLRGLSSMDIMWLKQAVLNASFPGPGAVYGTYYFGPVVDGTFIRDLPSNEFSKGHFYDVPMLVDHDINEGKIFINPNYTTQSQVTSDIIQFFPSGGPAFLSRLYQLYPPSAFNSTFWQAETWFGDFIINCPTHHISTRALDWHPTTPIYKLLFATGRKAHGGTLPYLCSTEPGFPDAANKTTAEIMSSYWISFITTGDPNVLKDESAPVWEGYGNVDENGFAGLREMFVGDREVRMEGDGDAGARCEFWGNWGDVTQS